MINTTYRNSQPNIFHGISRGGVPPTGSIPYSHAPSQMYHIPLQGVKQILSNFSTPFFQGESPQYRNF